MKDFTKKQVMEVFGDLWEAVEAFKDWHEGGATDENEAYDAAKSALMKLNINPIDENTSDGYHTFKELYRYRMLYNAAFFNLLAKYTDIPVFKSLRHSDGELCFGGGWFIVTAELPDGQISNHYEEKDWDYFHVPSLDKAPKWDGHSPEEAAERLEEFVLGGSKCEEKPRTVYVLHEVSYEVQCQSSDDVGVYSTLDNAKERLAELMKKYNVPEREGSSVNREGTAFNFRCGNWYYGFYISEEEMDPKEGC